MRDHGGCRAGETLLDPPGKKPSTQEWNQARAAAIGAQIRQIQQDLKQRSAAWTGKAISQALAQGTSVAERQAREAGVRRIPQLAGSFHVVDRKTVEQFARDTYADLAKATDGMGHTAQRCLRGMAAQGVTNAEVNTILAGGVIEGKPVAAIRELREQLKHVHGDTITITDKNGRPMHFKAGDYAKMVAVTKTRQAVCQARHERLADLGLDLVTIVGRISNNFCSAYLDKVFSISGTHPKYPPLDSLPEGGPPFHPNCTKSTAPYVEEMANPAEAKAAEPDQNLEVMTSTRDKTLLQKLYQDTQGRQIAQERHKQVVKAIAGAEPAAAGKLPQSGDANEARKELSRIESESLDAMKAIENERKELERRAQELGDQVNQTATDPANVQELNRAQEELSRTWAKLADLHAREKQIRESRTTKARGVLAVHQPVQVKPTFASVIRGDRKKVAQRGLEEFSKMVGVSDARAFATEVQGAQGNRASYFNKAIRLPPHTDVRTVIHEMGHALEEASPKVHRAALDFLARRTKGEPLRKLSEITGIRAYKSHEVAREDKFLHPYMGKDYGGGATEIVSMGLEYMWADPIDFARRDPDYFTFIYNLMRE